MRNTSATKSDADVKLGVPTSSRTSPAARRVCECEGSGALSGIRGRHGGRAGGDDRRRACDAEGVVGDLPSHPICGYSCVSGRDLGLASRGRSRMVGRRVKTNGR
jgi:hypothetical protein